MPTGCNFGMSIIYKRLICITTKSVSVVGVQSFVSARFMRCCKEFIDKLISFIAKMSRFIGWQRPFSQKWRLPVDLTMGFHQISCFMPKKQSP